MESISKERIIRTVLSPNRLNKLSGFASAYASSHVQVISDDGCSAKTSYEGDSSYSYYEITLGTDCSLKDNENDLVSDRFTRYSNHYLGLFYHEFFHVLYTNFVFIFKKLELVKDGHVHNFIMNILNIFEDFYIESVGTYYFPDSKKYIEFINDKDVHEKIQNKFHKIISDEILNDPEKMIAATWLLMNDPEGFSKNKIYLDNKKFFDISRQKMLLTFDSELRAKRQMLYATELLKMLENKNYQPEFNENKDLNDELRNSKCEDYVDECEDETLNQIMEALEELSRQRLQELEEKSGGNPQAIENKTMANDKEVPKEEISDEEETKPINEQDESNKTRRNKNPINLKQIPINTEPSSEDGIFLARMSNYQSEKVIKVNMRESNSTTYLDFINNNCSYINQIQNIINRIRLMSQGEVIHNQRSGKFDRKSACKQYPTITPFKKNIAPKILPDLVFHLVVDGSGSMSGRKEKEAINALLLFTTALERLGIPFAIEYFNDNYHSIERVIVKEYNDRLLYKKRLAYIYERQGWCDSGNIDEINILHASQDLKARKEKDKFMVVFSDGMTCGSEKDLHDLIVELDKQGMNPIGIGLGDDTVCGIYPTSIYLKNNEFDELISFLKDCLLRPFYKNLIK